MEAIDTYQIDRVIEGEPTIGSSVTLSSPPNATALRLPGCYMKAQFHHEGYDLVILTHGSFYGDQIEICLVRKDLMVENIKLIKLLQPGTISNIHITGPNELSFKFPEEQVWHLKLHDSLVWVWPFSIEITRSTRLRSYIELKKGPST